MPPEISFWNNSAFVLKMILSLGKKDQDGSTLNFTGMSFLCCSLLAGLPVGGISTFKYSFKMLTQQVKTIFKAKASLICEKSKIFSISILFYYRQILIEVVQIFAKEKISEVF